MKPSEKYEDILKQSGFVSDAAQKQAIALLDRLHDTLIRRETRGASNWWQRLLYFKKPLNPVRGIYFWGGVGRGKTFLMDIFYQCLPIEKKKRAHFHQFMNEIHHALKQSKDIENPLETIAGNLSNQFSVLCLDEFVIIDIGDAMIMAGLLEALFEQGVVLVTTSNSPPQNLYHDGLQRARFLPAIESIGQHCKVVKLDGGQDYRLMGLEQTHLYTAPHSPAVLDQIQHYLSEHVSPYQIQVQQLNINGRELDFQFCAEDTVWFGFDQLCKTTRSQDDYLELARLFNTLILTDIHAMSSLNDDVARRFVLLIDILYDHHVILICSASVRPELLYQGRRLVFEFERTASRLIEMQSQQYLAQAHTLQ
ncbi:MAG: AFG1 family ATPase [Proteobacteria bacterium]|nr:AFG1 family ATPase [Pseudomonadota bacterium]